MSTLNLTLRPEYFRLPTSGVDPHFGLSRAYYYELHATGRVLLVKLRKRGSQKGVTLVNYEAMSAFLAKTASGKPDPETPPRVVAPASGNAHRIARRWPDEVELMRKLTPSLLYEFMKTLVDLEEMVESAQS